MKARKDIKAATSMSGSDAEILDVLAARMNVSHAEVLRRALHLLATAHGLDTLALRTRPASAEWTGR